MTRLAIVMAVIAAVLIGLVVALRIPASQAWLEDLPGVGVGFEALAGVVHSRDNGPVEVVYAFDHSLTPAQLARARKLLAEHVRPLWVKIRGDQLVVEARTRAEVPQAFVEFSRAPLRLFVVVYQSAELDRIKRALREDEQAQKLGLTVTLDPIGYHLEASNEPTYVVPARHRIDAYVHGDPGLSVDAHPDVLVAPPGRAFYAQDDGRVYELESVPIVIERSQLVGARATGASLDVTLAPAQADAVAARMTASDVELVAEIAPGTLRAVAVTTEGHLSVAMPAAEAAQLAPELLLGGLGLHAVR